MEVYADSASLGPLPHTQEPDVRERLVLRLAELRIENERLREDNRQLRAALAIFSEVARRTQKAR